MENFKHIEDAIITAVEEIFASIGLEATHEAPRHPAGQSPSREIIVLLTFREAISGSFVFKSSLELGKLICLKMLGMDGTDNDNELLKDAMAETLNWMSGVIKRAYQEGTSIKISTPMVIIAEASAQALPETESGPEEETDNAEISRIPFSCEGHTFSMEIMMDE